MVSTIQALKSYSKLQPQAKHAISKAVRQQKLYDKDLFLMCSCIERVAEIENIGFETAYDLVIALAEV